MAAELNRRTLLIAGLGAALAACTRGSESAQPAATGSPSPTPSGTPSAAAAASSTPSSQAPSSQAPSPSADPQPAGGGWQPNRGELEPAAKVAAVRAIEAQGAAAGRPTQVIDAQYGGLLTATASVLVVTGGGTYDVRVARSGSTWTVTGINPSQPGASASTLTSAARGVLGSARIDLPPASRADIASGQVHDSVLNALLALAGTYRVGVSVVRSGHPLLVFGTSRPSDHPRGRAFDVWSIDGAPVVDPGTSRALVTGFMRAAAATGAYNVGGPYLLGSPPQYFSDRTHHDHVHVGFSQ